MNCMLTSQQCMMITQTEEETTGPFPLQIANDSDTNKKKKVKSQLEYITKVYTHCTDKRINLIKEKYI